MKTDWPTPHNPEQVILDPGYRFLGVDEAPRNDDETPKTDKSGWMKWGTTNTGQKAASPRVWTVRRALCVDDRDAPPPEEWSREGWEVLTKLPDHASEGEQWWGEYTRRWINSKAGYGYEPMVYARRPKVALNQQAQGPFTTVQLGTQTCVPSRSATVQGTVQGSVLAVHAGQVVSIAPTQPWVAFKDSKPTNEMAKAGLWLTDGFTVMHYQSQGIVMQWAYSWTHWMPVIQPALPEKPKPVGPTINGYQASYLRRSPVVTFGCAKLAVGLLRRIIQLETDKVSIESNRTISNVEVTLSSGVTLTANEIKAILAYVDAVNGDSTKG